MNAPLAAVPTDLDRLLVELRPKLHRYCARMTGSAIDGEDAVQEAMIKALQAFPAHGSLVNPEGWLFRIAQNAALDVLRARKRRAEVQPPAELEGLADPAPRAEPLATSIGLRTFMRLPAAQRSAVILMDVLGYSLRDICEITGASLAGVKASLHRGRAKLRDFADEPQDYRPPELAGPERALLASYVKRFNDRDFDAVRDMLADEVRLELVNRQRLEGAKAVGGYFTNYASRTDWRLAPGLVEGRPAALVFDVISPGEAPTYFILLDWEAGRLVAIRDFRYARNILEGADLVLDPA